MIKYPVNEIFLSVQGEGSYVGALCSFIRLAGCPVGCEFCDTDKTVREELTVEQILERIPYEVGYVVITGGEPAQYDLFPLFEQLTAAYEVHLETSGVFNWKPTFDHVSVSPKKGHPLHAAVVDKIDDCKWLYPMWSLEEIISRAEKSLPETVVHWIQPINEQKQVNLARVQECFEIMKRAPWLRLSPQIHKLLGLR